MKDADGGYVDVVTVAYGNEWMKIEEGQQPLILSDCEFILLSLWSLIVYSEFCKRLVSQERY